MFCLPADIAIIKQSIVILAGELLRRIQGTYIGIPGEKNSLQNKEFDKRGVILVKPYI